MSTYLQRQNKVKLLFIQKQIFRDRNLYKRQREEDLEIMNQYSQRVRTLTGKLEQLKRQLILRLVENRTEVILSHIALRYDIYKFTDAKPTIQQRAHINQRIRLNIREFIRFYMQPRIINIIQRNDPYFFVETMNQIWNNYQRFVFAHDFIVDKLKIFYETFYKMPVAKNYQQNGQVVAIPAMAVNQLKDFFGRKNYNLFEAFPRHFCNFIAKQREGLSVPRQMLKQSMAAIESCYFDFQAMILLDSNKKPSILKNPKGTQAHARKSKDSKYFEDYIVNQVLQDCQSFYRNLVHEKSPKLNPSQQLDLMTKIINEQQSRSVFYIHTPENQRKYIETVNQYLIGLDLESRIKKDDGLMKYLRQYQIDKQDYKVELVKFWKIYSRILGKSLPQILKIYSAYLDQQAIVAEQKIQRAMEFIPEIIRINTNNIQIIEFFGFNFELENKRNQKIRGILSNEIVKVSKYFGKHTMGASNLSQFVNNKFKEIYVKGWQGNKQTFDSIVLLFKILQQKVHFTKQHEKFTATRFLEDVDFSKDNEYTLIINLQKKFIQEMQKEMGISEVKQLLQNVKDMQKSADHTKRMKQKIGSQIHILNQIIVKNNTFWPQRNIYEITPPTLLLKTANQVENYFSNTSNIMFEYNNGVSLFRGQFKSKVPKQNFLLKNIYMIILFTLDESPQKKMLYGDIKSRIKSYGAKKENGNLELSKNIIELLHIGLLQSSTKKLSKEDPKCIKLSQSDLFQLNPQFDYEQQLKKNKVPPKMIKKLPVIKTMNIKQMTPDWIKKMFQQQSNQLAEDEVLMEKQRRLRAKQISVKFLKHAHNSNKDVTLQQLFNEYSIPKNRQYRVTQKYLKQIIQQLINDQYCERVQGKRNVFKYKA